MNYVEPCCGACSVLLQKPRSPLETVNDLDGNVVNFFRVLRDRPDELIRKIRLTPWARAEYELSLEPCEDVVERARRFFVASWMSIQGGHHSKMSKTWRMHKDANNMPWTPGFKEFELIKDCAHEITERLLMVQIDNRDACDVIRRYDNDNALIYFDPPYLPETRTEGDRYRLECAKQFHITAADLLHQCEGYVVVSGYACPLYTELYEAHGWHRVDKEAQTNSGGKRIESLWLSPRTVEALGMPEQLSF